MTLYRTLEVAEHAAPEIIRAAYRILSARTHPDRCGAGDATERMQQINAAYATLSDPVRRAHYDADLRAQRASASADVARPGPTAAPMGRRGVLYIASRTALCCGILFLIWRVGMPLWWRLRPHHVWVWLFGLPAYVGVLFGASMVILEHFTKRRSP